MKRSSSLIRAVRLNIFVGALLVTPVAATIVILNFLVNLATGWMPNIFKPLLDSIGPLYLQRLAILVVTLLLLYLAGALARNLIGRRLYVLGDRLLAGIPIVRDVYTSASRIIESLFSQRKSLFQEAVLIEYPRRGIYSIAFVTARLPSDLTPPATAGDCVQSWVTLFVPTTPNPTSGILICAPRSELLPLKIPISEALTFVMSAGAVARSDNKMRKTLLDQVDEWLRDGDKSEAAGDQ